MRLLVCALLLGLLCLLDPSTAKESPPKVQVYSRVPGEYGKNNTIVCHVSGFHPPEIRIELLRNGEEIPKATQSDLAFEENWHYHLTRHASFTPKEGEVFSCRVTHMGNRRQYHWEPDM